MAKLNPDTVRNEKEAAQYGSVGMNDAAAILAGASAVAAAAGAATAVTGVGAVAGVGAAAVLAGLSAIAWYLGNRYSEAAADPPRRDFEAISLASVNPELRIPSDPWHAAWHAYAQRSLLLSSAVNDLVLSMERYQGASEETQQRLASVQLEAIRHNASVCAELQDRLAIVMPRVNVAWYEFESLFPDVDNIWRSLTLEEIRAVYERLSSYGLEQIVRGIRFPRIDADLLVPSGEHPIMTAERVPERPEILLSDPLYRTVLEMPRGLRELVVLSP